MWEIHQSTGMFKDQTLEIPGFTLGVWRRLESTVLWFVDLLLLPGGRAVCYLPARGSERARSLWELQVRGGWYLEGKSTATSPSHTDRWGSGAAFHFWAVCWILENTWNLESDRLEFECWLCSYCLCNMAWFKLALVSAFAKWAENWTDYKSSSM